jgi:hypothetical protein
MVMTDSSGLGVATQVSNPAGGPYVAAGISAAPGAGGVGASLQISHAVLVIIGGAATFLVVMGIVFRKS